MSRLQPTYNQPNNIRAPLKLLIHESLMKSVFINSVRSLPHFCSSRHPLLAVTLAGADLSDTSSTILFFIFIMLDGPLVPRKGVGVGGHSGALIAEVSAILQNNSTNKIYP